MLTKLPIPKLLMAFLLGTSMITFGQRPEEIKLNTKQKPDDNRFTPVVLAQDLDEPMVFSIAKNGKVFIAERKGDLKVYDPITETTKLVDKVVVNTKYTNAAGVQREAEEGFIGMSLDPNFETNHFVYLLYAHPTVTKHVLERREIVNDKFVKGSEKVLLEYGTQRELCCHTGGGMTWDAKGNLYITVGNNTQNSRSSQTDERPGQTSRDDQRGSANTNDLRGKILRIHPEPDGSYSIPQGNLFPVGTPRTRPEIYTMGHRNAWRPSIDSKTGFLYWGEVGPDASEDTEVGPRGYDELNQARGPGFFGWPYFIGENHAFPYFDFYKNQPLAAKDPKKPINNSVNNSGLSELPPAQPAFISYPYGPSERFPEVGTGGRAAVGGPIYHASDFADAKRPFPDYFEGKWIATDYSRDWIMAITMNEKGDYVSMERILPNYHPVNPIDLKFGPTGDLYVLDYGSNGFRKSDNSQLVKIEFNGGNRKPLVEASASKPGGTVPAKITLSSAGTIDYDGDALKYEWKVVPDGGGDAQVFSQANPTVTLSKAGVYTATLTVSDPKGEKNSKSLKMIAGNEPPVVAVNLTGNKTFFFPNKPLAYTVSVDDKEDGSLANGKIDQSKVAVSIDYISEGFDYAEVEQGQRSVDASARYAVAQALIAKSDCKNCHNVTTPRSIGPAFTEIAAKYMGKATAVDTLTSKVRKGGNGVWGTEAIMPGHPFMSANDVSVIVRYILNINDKTISTLPVKGTHTQDIPDGDTGRGTLVLRAAYTDNGSKSAPVLTGENQITLRSPQISAPSADVMKNTYVTGAGANEGLVAKKNAQVGFKKIDLTGIKQLEIGAAAATRTSQQGGTIEVRLDSPTGTVLGQTELKPVAQQQGGGQAAAGQRAGQPAAQGGGNPFAGLSGKTVDIPELSGLHDIYFVFKNDKVTGANDPLMTFTSVKFNDVKK